MNDDASSRARRITRRQFLAVASTIGAAAAWASKTTRPSRATTIEARDLYPEGVASGDPDSNSVLVWTRRPYDDIPKAQLTVEVADDEAFSHVVAIAHATVSEDSDWTCRVLVGNLQPSHIYWYRFLDENGHASRTGRTITAPPDNDPRTARFAFVSCQNINEGVLHAYRRMIADDERAPESERLDFILHLGDFIYEVVWYPEDWPPGKYQGRVLRDKLRYPHGERITDTSEPSSYFHVPTTLEDYRTAYRAYLHDPDLQDARARWPFVCMWDNHEFSQGGWQSIQTFNGESWPAQERKVAANQAWFEYQPARIVKSSGPGLDTFDPPEVKDSPILRFDADGLGDEPNNRAALASLTAYRAFRWGRNVDLLITDQHSYRSEDPTSLPQADPFSSPAFPLVISQDVLELLDAGRAYNAENAPEKLAYGHEQISNFRKESSPQTILGAEQKRWFLKTLRDSTATWKIWGNSIGTLDGRADLQNLPPGLGHHWPGSGYALLETGDFAYARLERAQVYSTVRDGQISGFVTVSGNSHSFWAGLASAELPPRLFDPVGIAFVTGTLSSVGAVESLENNLPSNHPLRPLYLQEQPGSSVPHPACNLLFKHGVRACLEYQKTGDLVRARAKSNPQLAPHLSFLDLDGHGYSLARVSIDAFECEFVCIPRPPAIRSDEVPVLYRIVHRAQLWRPGEKPTLEQRILEGDPALSI